MKSLFKGIFLLGLVWNVKAVEEVDDAIILEDDSVDLRDSKSSASHDVQTRLFTGNTQLDSGLAGLAVGLGGALLVGHLLNEGKQKQQRRCRYKRDGDETNLRFLNFGGKGNGPQEYCPPGSYEVPYDDRPHHGSSNYNPPRDPYHNSHSNSYNRPSGNHYRPTSPPPYYPPPTHAPYRPPTQAPYRPPTQAPYRPPTQAPYHGPQHGPYRPSSNYNPGPYSSHSDSFRPYNSGHSPNQGYRPDNGYRVPSSGPYRSTPDPFRKPHNVLFEPRSNLKNLDEKIVQKSGSPTDRTNKKSHSDAIRFGD